MYKQLFIYCYMVMATALMSQTALAQKAYFEPDPMDPEEMVTLYIDIAQCECQKLVGTDQQLYLWTWVPADPVGVGGNGSWNSSNEAMALTKVEGDKWKFEFIPTELYGKSADEIFASGKLSFLAKMKDGGSGGACELENKTEDIHVDVKRPASPNRKIYSFPIAYITDYSTNDTMKLRGEDVITIIYNNNFEQKPTMQSPDELFLFIKATDNNGVVYKSAQNVGSADNDGSLTKMTNEANRIYSFTFIPDQFFQLSEGTTITNFSINIIKKGYVNSNDAVDGTYNYVYRCDE